MNFDKIIDRSKSNAYKWVNAKPYFGTDDLIPLWVADMDFETPECIRKAIADRLTHPILGYTIPTEELPQSIINWVKNKHSWDIAPQNIGYIPGVVPGISIAIQIFSEVGDDIIINTPVYPPFLNVPVKNNRNVIANNLLTIDGKFCIDFEALEKQITPKTKMIILCNPHNPGGRVWSREELLTLANFAEKHNLFVVSDEIHSDLVWEPYKHTVFATVSEYAKNNSITFMAPSKTFNMAGMVSAFYIAENKEVFDKFQNFLLNLELLSGNLFAYYATQAAYNYGGKWLTEMLKYVKGNYEYTVEYFSTNFPELKIMTPEASFLLWVDFSGWGMSDIELKEFMVKEAKVGFNFGPTFGQGGEQHLRINIGTSRLTLEEVYERIKKAKTNK